jgi:signal transduction histidine kinase
MRQKANSGAKVHRLLLISDQGGFSRDVVARWQMQASLPEFTALSPDLWKAATSPRFDAAIAGDLSPQHAVDVLTRLNRTLEPAIYVTAPGEMVPALRREYPHVLIVPRHDAWLDTLVLVAEEMMKRIDISAQCEALEQSARSGRKYATLGQYMVDMRHGFNNALTSVLGNAELLLLESGVLTADMREQLETLHAMTLRLHEMMQRFTSLELEMRCSERSARSDSDGMAASVSAGA